MFLSVVLPQYNEFKNIKAGVLQSIYDYLSKQKYSWEVIIVDDGSTDTTADEVDKIIKTLNGFRQIRASHGGKPVATSKGIEAATGEWILLSDMDQSTPISEVEKLFKYTNDYPVVIGSRGKRRNEATLLRKTAGVVFSTYRRVLVLSHIVDTQCGFKLFRSDILKQYFPHLGSLNKNNVKGWSVSAYDVELLFMIDKGKYKIKEVPVIWKDQDISNTKERKFINESLDMMKQILLVQLNNITGKYKHFHNQKEHLLK